MTDFDENQSPVPAPDSSAAPVPPTDSTPVPSPEIPVSASDDVYPVEPSSLPSMSDESEVTATEPPVPVQPSSAAAPSSEPAPLYRWTYADQTAHDSCLAARGRKNGVLVYTLVMAGVFLVSFGLLIAVLLVQGGIEPSGSITRPGISADVDEEAVEGVEQAKHSVVVIEVKTASGGGTGTGIVMTSDGYIATNHHVIDGATSIRVTFYDGTVLAAELIGSSEMDDLGVIKVARTDLKPATFAHSDDCYVGQTVYAIGTPAGPEFSWTTTRGIISYKDREVKMYDEEDGTLLKKLRLLQTDANVNPGNSGGPLINTKGEVVGVVSMKLSEGYEGIGFAIPSDGAVEILEAIMRDGHAGNVNSSLSHKRPMLGIMGFYVEAKTHYRLNSDDSFAPITPEEAATLPANQVAYSEEAGIYVISLTAGLNAAEKLEYGDVITAVQGLQFESMSEFMDIINDYYAGDTVTLTVWRDGTHIPVDIVLSAQPD